MKLLHGDRKDRINPAEPHPDPTEPQPPRELSARAKRVWLRVLAAYRGTGVITMAETDTLRVYSEAMARYETAMKSHASNREINDLATTVLRYARDLGLTPASRSSIHAPAKPVDPLNEFLAAGVRLSDVSVHRGVLPQ